MSVRATICLLIPCLAIAVATRLARLSGVRNIPARYWVPRRERNLRISAPLAWVMASIKFGGQGACGSSRKARMVLSASPAAVYCAGYC